MTGHVIDLQAGREQGGAVDRCAGAFLGSHMLSIFTRGTDASHSASTSRPRRSSNASAARRSAELSQACVEDIDYAARRELDKALVGQLATCR